MKKLLKYIMDPQRWLPMAASFLVGLLLAFLGNVLFGTELKALGILVAVVLLVLFLGLLSLAFFLLYMVQQRARWEHERLKAGFEIMVDYARSESQWTHSERRLLAEKLPLTASEPKDDSQLNAEVLKLVQQAIDLNANQKKPLVDKVKELQTIVLKIQETLKPNQS